MDNLEDKNSISYILKNYHLFDAPKLIRQMGLKKFFFKLFFILGVKDYFIDKTAVIEGKKNVRVGKGSEIWEYVVIRARSNKVTIGENCQINPFTCIFSGSEVKIGNNVLIAPHCMIVAGNHDLKQVDVPLRFAGSKSKGPVIIEDNVWVGANVTILDGIRIGKEAVVGANSVVTKNVQPYDIVAGVPARVIGNRLKDLQ